MRTENLDFRILELYGFSLGKTKRELNRTSGFEFQSNSEKNCLGTHHQITDKIEIEIESLRLSRRLAMNRRPYRLRGGNNAQASFSQNILRILAS